MTLSSLAQTWKAFNEDKATRLAAAIAYSTIFSLAPLFIVLIAIGGWFLGTQNGGHGHRQAEDLLVGAIERHTSRSTAEALREIIGASFGKPRQSVVAQIVGWATFLFGASALFSSIQDALNSIWRVEETKGGWRQMLRDRLASFGMLLVVGFLLLVSLVGTIVVASFGGAIAGRLPFAASPAALAVAGQGLSAGVVLLLFAAMYKILPSVDLRWRDVWTGAAATTVLFVAGEVGVAFYLRTAGTASAYGGAGSLLVALIWIYYTALIFLLGAEFTKIHAGRVATTAASVIRTDVEHPVGVDPREAAGIAAKEAAPHAPTP